MPKTSLAINSAGPPAELTPLASTKFFNYTENLEFISYIGPLCPIPPFIRFPVNPIKIFSTKLLTTTCKQNNTDSLKLRNPLLRPSRPTSLVTNHQTKLKMCINVIK